MKGTNVFLGIVFFAFLMLLFVTRKRLSQWRKSLTQGTNEGFSDQSAGSIIGMVMASVMGIGLLIALVGAMSEGGKY